MENNFIPTRIMKTYMLNLCAGAETVFPLLCPVKEADWIDGWKQICNVIYTESGIAEEACVFETNSPSEGKAIWICSKYDSESKEIEYVKHILDKAIIKWTMEVKDRPGNQSSIFVVYSATGLTQNGNAFVKEFMETRFPIFMQGLEDCINYYVTTGKMKERR